MKTVQIKVEIKADVPEDDYCAKWNGYQWPEGEECEFLNGFVYCRIFQKGIRKNKDMNLKKCRACLDAGKGEINVKT